MTEASNLIVVSGLPRSGTSLMMQMLAAGGIPPLTDQIRRPDEDNPRGYFEFERVKQLKQDKAWLAEASGKAVKIVHLLLSELPLDRSYRVIFMRRKMSEILASQHKMLTRAGRSIATTNPESLGRNFETQVAQVLHWLRARPNFQIQEVWHHDLLASPQGQATRLNRFLGGHLDKSAMATVVDPALHRNRST
jgi:hypothetical protein